MGTSFQEDLIEVLPRNAREEVRVSLSSYRGRQALDLRIFADHAGKGRIPTQKGLSISPERIPDLIQALQKAQAAAALPQAPTRDVSREQWWQR